MAALAPLGEGRVLVVLRRDDVGAWKSFRNLPRSTSSRPQLNAYDVLVNDWWCSPDATCRPGAALLLARRRCQEPREPLADQSGPRRRSYPPVVSEKSYGLIEEGVYTFVVHPDATKPRDPRRDPVIFGVKVKKVNTLNRKGKRKRNRKPDVR